MERSSIPAIVARHLVGDNGPSTQPGDDPRIYGTATLNPAAAVEARSFHSETLTYTVGALGLDDTGAIQVSWRLVSDSGSPQMDFPTAPNYVTASSTGKGQLVLKYDKMGGTRPWRETLTIYQRGGYLKEGDQIVVVFGDRTFGSPGMLAQTFAEGGREFRLSADVQATGNFVEIPGEQLFVPIIAGPPVKWKAVLPTLRRPNESFFLGLKAEDKWGNPSAMASGQLKFRPNLAVEGLPHKIDFPSGERAMTVQNLRVLEPGTLVIDIFDGQDLVAQAGPLVIKPGELASYWGDLHGQTGETVGTNTAESYFDFARNKAFLDVTSHQANDFQINTAFWNHLNDLTAEWNEPGRFTVLPGYEWSGNTAVGGDHNVFFRTEGRTIRRCSHALLENRSEIQSDANTLTDLFQAFRNTKEDVVVYAHVGGRYANIQYDHDPLIETAVEIHSAWGTFEWILTDGFELKRRVGIVCNSDGHKGRPGASYPGDSVFGAYGGLTCFVAAENTREAIFEAQRRRHHFGTTGCRMFMDVALELPVESTVFERNPDAMPDTKQHLTVQAVMGDIVQTSATSARLTVDVRAHAGIERVEVRNGKEVIETLRSFNKSDLGNRIRVLCSGAETRGRGRTTRWNGHARFAGTRIKRFETINQWNPDSFFEQRGSNSVVWDMVTTGNYIGFDAWLESDFGQLEISTNHADLQSELSQLGLEGCVADAGGLQRQIKASRLPESPLEREMEFQIDVDVGKTGDNPIWISVFTEDGYQGWSSPIYVFR